MSAHVGVVRTGDGSDARARRDRRHRARSRAPPQLRNMATAALLIDGRGAATQRKPRRTLSVPTVRIPIRSRRARTFITLDQARADRAAAATAPADAVMTSLLCPDAFLSPLEIDAAVMRALAEDLGRAGDVTSTATVPEGTRARAVVVARKAGTISGLPLVEAALLKLDPDDARSRRITATALRSRPGPQLMTIEGDARAVLSAERAALNFLGHLSGIATAAASFVKLIAHTKARVCCTRKTTPGLRALGEIRGALRRRVQSPLRARRRDPDQGQPHRGRGRHRGGARGAPRRSPDTWSRSRSRSIRSTSCARC